MLTEQKQLRRQDRRRYRFAARDSNVNDNGAETAPTMDGDIAAYHDLTRQIERLHRRFLDVVRAQLDRLGVDDVNPVQCLTLVNIADEEINIRTLMERGYYLGSNASYNVKKLVESGYIEQMISERDRRSTILRLTAKGRSLRSRIAGAQALLAEQIPGVDLANANETLRRIERLWDDAIRSPNVPKA